MSQENLKRVRDPLLLHRIRLLYHTVCYHAGITNHSILIKYNIPSGMSTMIRISNYN